MSIKYDSRRESLAEIIKKATINATYVIPDLQRPFVWTPRQVTLLIDSLFRGWPFGSLLLWEVKPDCFDKNDGIPHRPFWQVIDRTKDDSGTAASSLGQPATYQMVLDGQQRVQSLILALGGDQWGFQLDDTDWALDLQDRRVKPSKHWSKASLCVDLTKFDVELRAKSDTVRKIEVGKILEWAVLDEVLGRSKEPRPTNYVYPVESAQKYPGRFIRLSRIWDLAQKDLSESEYRKLIEPMLREHSVSEEDIRALLNPLAEFMKVVESVKTISSVHALQIESFELTPQWSKDDYSDAIVNIFTRLNTAGRTLSREEITLAWLKIGWLPAQTNGKTAGQCLDDLKAALSDRGFDLETDDVVRLISFIWSVEHRTGTLLDSKDLLKGEIVRSMAAAIASSWGVIEPLLRRGADLVKERDLIENQGSFNAIIVFLAWHRLAFGRFDAVCEVLSVVEKDSLEKKLNLRAAHFLDRWIFGSQWASVWGDGAVLNFQNFAADLHSFQLKLIEVGPRDLIAVVDDGIRQLMDRVAPKATERVNGITITDRRRVHTYFPMLWVWHRLDGERWKYSSIPLRTGRKRAHKLEVDHTVADAWWGRLVDKEIAIKMAAFAGSEQERASIAPDEFESRSEAIAFINMLGNCSLLDKSFNISKSDSPLWEFLQQVHEFEVGEIKRSEWESALLLPEALTSPDDLSLKEIKHAVQLRDSLIRRDLVDFIAGNRLRVD